jgi:hypothetical protein
MILRQKLWTQDRLNTHPLGSQVPLNLCGYRPGPAELLWRQQVRWIGNLSPGLALSNEEVAGAFAVIDSELSDDIMWELC